MKKKIEEPKLFLKMLIYTQSKHEMIGLILKWTIINVSLRLINIDKKDT